MSMPSPSAGEAIASVGDTFDSAEPTIIDFEHGPIDHLPIPVQRRTMYFQYGYTKDLPTGQELVDGFLQTHDVNALGSYAGFVALGIDALRTDPRFVALGDNFVEMDIAVISTDTRSNVVRHHRDHTLVTALLNCYGAGTERLDGRRLPSGALSVISGDMLHRVPVLGKKEPSERAIVRAFFTKPRFEYDLIQ